ncbi:WD40-repeat-containing domain protein [Podospora fimiseda]|uniref:WD40-repeat-containing domain protein n=1 Tax=Podospora fimiseda TaxID=252190 RepID=A0AAN7H4J8_9PEZI|nr:WD40-repeat-containing domain protein [Podospora fimiseda]
MLFSRSLRSSPHALPSPDGNHIAVLSSLSVINIRALRSLEPVSVIKLPQDFVGPVISFQWSPSSRLLLVAGPDQVRIWSALDSTFHATIRHSMVPGTKPAHVGFGASDSEVCIISSFGLKFAVFDLASSKTIEVASPKVFSPSSACRCFSFRPETRHLALLTRVAGKDMISIHSFPTRELQRSWAPETVDAQGLEWSPDGHWLVVWDSAAQGHRVVFYTSDGHLFKTWSGPANPSVEDRDFALGAGVKALQFSPDAQRLAIGDSSRSVCIISMTSAVTETMRLRHPKTLVPSETLQVWQEQIGISQTGPAVHAFLRTTQVISPAPRLQDNSEPVSGCAAISFDPSSVLAATRLDDSPGTIWIWDLQAAELRAVLLFHGNVSSLSWHPNVPETLLVKCEGDQYNALVFVWDPLSEGPRPVDFGQRLPERKTSTSKHRISWLGLDVATAPSLFFTDNHNFVLACLAESDQVPPPWGDQEALEPGFTEDTREESPLELVPAAEDLLSGPKAMEEGADEDLSELEDTFVHKR